MITPNPIRLTLAHIPRGQHLGPWLFVFGCVILPVAVGWLVGASSAYAGGSWFLLVALVASASPLIMRALSRFTIESLLIILLIATPLLRCIGAFLPQTSLAVAVLRDVILLLVYLRWIFALLSRRLPLPHHPAALIWLFFLLWGGTQLLRGGNLLANLVALRDWFRFVPLYFLVLSLLQHRPGTLKRLLAGIVISGVILALLQLCVYTFTYASSTSLFDREYRAIGPLKLIRMPTLMGGGPSGLGLFLASAVCIPMTYWLFNRPIPSWWRWGSLAMLSVVVLTMAYSAWMALLCSAVLSSWVARRFTLAKSILLAFIILFLLANLGYSFDVRGEESLIEYLTYVSNIWEQYLSWTLDSPLLGQGLALVGEKAFIESSVQEALQLRDIDSGWVGLVIRYGYPIVLALALTVVLVFAMSVRTIKRRLHRMREPPDLMVLYAAAVPAFLATMFSYHTVPWQRFGLDLNFFILFAAISVMGRGFVCRDDRETETSA